jgi:hypothetical protein
MSQRSKRIFARLIFGFGFMILLLGLCEVFVRVVFGDKIVRFPRFHDEADYGAFKIRRLRPQTTFVHQSVDGRWVFQTNKQGFRDDHDYPYQKRTNCLRVLCLGDSQTEGFESAQADTYAKVFERYVRARGIDVEVLNAGVSGFGTAEQLIFLENEGIRYHPDVVVVGFFANDPDDNVKSDLFRLKDGALVTNKFEHLPGVKALQPLNNFPVTRWCSQHSQLYSLVLNAVWDTMKARLSRKAQAAVPTEFAIGQKNQDQKATAYQEQLTGALLRRMNQFCQTNGVQLWIVDIPSRLTSSSSFEPSIPADLNRLVTENSSRVFWSTNLFADYRDTLPVFVTHGQWHISSLAHATIGITLGKALLANPAPVMPVTRP